MELSALINETPESSLASFAMWSYSKMAAYESEVSGLLLGTESAGALFLDLQASRSVRNKCLLFKLPNLWYFFYSGSNRLRQWQS